MAVTDKVNFQWLKQPNGILRIIELVLSIAILVVVHTILSNYVTIPPRYVGKFNESGIETTDDNTTSKQQVEANEEESGHGVKPVIVVGDESLHMNHLIQGLNVQAISASNFVEIISAGNLFAIVFFLISYISGESEFAHRLTTEICLDVVHAVLNGAAGGFLMYRRENPVTRIEDPPALTIAGALFLVLTVVFFIDVICLVRFVQPVTQKPQSLISSVKTPSEQA